MPLILLGAPLGNAADASRRLATVLASADVIAAEDTRRLHRLAHDVGATVTGRVVSYFEGNEERRTADLLAALTAGQQVALVTDGGMPSVSDPGYRLVRAALDAGVPVTVAPGPSAVTTALAISGLPCDRFCFEGFPPRKPGERRALFATLASEARTMVFFESPHRIAATLDDLVNAFGADRAAALCREMTKTYEEVRRLPLGELAASVAADPPRGEITLVIAGTVAAPIPASAAELGAAVRDLVDAGTPKKDAIASVARRYGVPKRHVYTAALEGGSPC